MNSFSWAILTSLIWGCVPVIEKLGLTKMNVYLGLLFRCSGVLLGVGLLLLFKFATIKQAFHETTQGWAYLVLGGILASFLGQLFFYFSLKSGETSKVVPIAASYPLISFILGVIFLGEQLTLAKAGGLLFVILGIFLLN